MVKQKIKLGVSSCLLGNPVRYDGRHKRDPFLVRTLGTSFDLVPVCPEVGAGLSVPREQMRLVGKPGLPRIVAVGSGTDLTGIMRTWAKRKAREIARDRLCGFISKSRSPSCALTDADLFTSSGHAAGETAGIFPALLRRQDPLLPLIDEEALADEELRENFVERVVLYDRWTSFAARRPALGSLVAFHSNQKLLLMAHSPRHYSALGRLVAGARNRPIREVYVRYISLLMEGLGVIATPRKNANVLQHIMGYFKKQLSAGEKRKLLDLIDQHRKGRVPLAAPLAQLRYCMRRFGAPYLEQQAFLDPGLPGRLVGRQGRSGRHRD